LKFVLIITKGKAVLKMCEEFLNQLEMSNNLSTCDKLRIKSGILSVPIGSQTNNSLFTKYNVKYFCGALNNMPDIDSQNTTLEIVDLIKKAKLSAGSSQTPLIISFISGGGSALLPLPKPMISLDQKCSLISKLVQSGATITELNKVRRSVSQVKCGKLAILALSQPNPAQLISFIISDIINDPIELIASGPTVICDRDQVKPSEEALSVLEKFHIKIDENLKNTILSEDSELNSSHNIASDKLSNIIIGNNTIALKVAQKTATQLGYKVIYLGNDINGEASDVAKQWAQIAINYKETEEDLSSYKGICWIAGGETTVNMHNSKIGDK
jgi:glycerate-2-kinase